MDGAGGSVYLYMLGAGCWGQGHARLGGAFHRWTGVCAQMQGRDGYVALLHGSQMCVPVCPAVTQHSEAHMAVGWGKASWEHRCMCVLMPPCPWLRPMGRCGL